MSSVQEHYEHLKGQENEMVEEVRRYVEIESCSRDKEDVDRVGREVTPAFEELGFTVERIQETECGDHLVARRSGNGRGRLLSLIHLDTTWPRGSLKANPFRVEEGLAFGPAILDMKGGWVVLLSALRSLKAANWDELAEITVFMTADEQLGSPQGRPWIEKEARNSDWSLVMEPGRDGGGVTLERGAVGAVYFDIHGVLSQATSRELGASAIVEAAHKIPALEELSDVERGTLVNVGLIEGGTARQRVPHHVWMSIDVRALKTDEAEQLVSRIRDIAKHVHVPKTSTEMSGGVTRPAVEASPGSQQLLELAKECGSPLGMDITPVYSPGGSDGSFTAGLIPTLDGLGVEGVREPGIPENLRVDSLPRRAAMLAGIIEGLPGLLETEDQ